MGKMEGIRKALERAVEEQWGAEQQSDAVRDSALRDATAAPWNVKLAEVARLVVQPAVENSAPPAPAARSAAIDKTSIRTVPVDAGIFAEERLVAALGGSSGRQAFCVLQAVVAERLDERRATTLGVTGARNGAGKTLTAINLAIALARDGRRRVLLVDLDLDRPAVHARFGCDARTGVEDCLFEGVAPSGSLFCPSVDGLAVLPARGGSRNVAQILRSANLATMLEGLKRFRPSSIIILDLPPIADKSDASAFEQLADALLVVVEDGVTTEREFRRVTRAISPAKLLGTVLNRAEALA